MPTDPALNVVYSRDPDFDFSRSVFKGLHRALTAHHTADTIGDLGSPLTPLTDEQELGSPLTPVTDEESLGSPLLKAESSSSPRASCSTSHSADAVPLSIADSSNCSQNDFLALVPSTQLASAITTHVPEPSSRASKRKAQKKEAARRRAKKRKFFDNAYHPDPQLAEKHRRESSSILTEYDAKNFGISSKGYIGIRTPKKSSRAGSQVVNELLGSKFNFGYVDWNGSSDRPISDTNGLVLGACVSAPRGDESWEDVHRRAAQAIEEAGRHLVFDKKEKQHRRGKFPAANVGISHGGGQPRPKVLDHNAHNKKILDSLLQEDAFIRISGFTTGAFATWAPRLYAYENKYLDDLIAHDRKLRETNTHPRPQEEPLRRNFPNTPWASAAFNFGPRTICRKHLDSGNLAFGWCIITALGNYDYTKGGHLILWDLKLVIQFPPGTSIMIPSCAIAHSNTRIQQGEKRFSFTQYTSGGIFRWVDNGYRTVEDFMGGLGENEKASVLEQLATQLEHGLSLYSTLDELQSRHSSE